MQNTVPSEKRSSLFKRRARSVFLLPFQHGRNLSFFFHALTVKQTKVKCMMKRDKHRFILKKHNFKLSAKTLFFTSSRARKNWATPAAGVGRGDKNRFSGGEHTMFLGFRAVGAGYLFFLSKRMRHHQNSLFAMRIPVICNIQNYS